MPPFIFCLCFSPRRHCGALVLHKTVALHFKHNLPDFHCYSFRGLTVVSEVKLIIKSCWEGCRWFKGITIAFDCYFYLFIYFILRAKGITEGSGEGIKKMTVENRK